MMRSVGRSRGLRALSVLASACALAVGAVVAPSPGAHADNTKAQASDQAYYSHYSLASLHAQGYTGEGVIIAVIDGRVDTTIPELQGASVEDMTPCTVQSDSSNDDHATSIAQLLVAPDFGIAPGATIYNYVSVPNINDAGSDCALGSRASALGDHSGLIEEALNDGAHIIVISSNIFSRDRESLRWAVSRAVVEGVPVVVSMGNESTRNQDRSLVLWGGVVGVAALSVMAVTLITRTMETECRLLLLAKYGYAGPAKTKSTRCAARRTPLPWLLEYWRWRGPGLVMT